MQRIIKECMFKLEFIDCCDESTESVETFNTWDEADDFAIDLKYEYSDIAIDECGNDYWKTFTRYSYLGDTYNSYSIIEYDGN